MKKSRFTEHQIVKIINKAEAGVSVNDLARQYGFGRSTFYKWKSKYGGTQASDLKRLRELEAENRRLKQMYANLSLEHQALKDIVEKSSSDWGATGPGQVRHSKTLLERAPGLSHLAYQSICLPLCSRYDG